MVKLHLVAEHAGTTVTPRDWYEAYHLAQRFGWHPVGTIKRGEVLKCECTWQGGPMCSKCQKAADRWTGDYLSQECQLVTDDDAARLAEALEAAADQVPDLAPPWRYTALSTHEHLPPDERLTEDLLEYWAARDDGGAVLDSILAVARCGEFRIG